MSTVYNWLEKLGFKYEVRKKHYYVDNHEAPETMKHRALFVDEYLKREVCMHRWIQLTLAEHEKLVEEQKIIDGSGYKYIDDENQDLVEVHVDDLPEEVVFQKSKTIYGGNLSVRKPLDKKPVIIFGQDETIIKQFMINPKQWVGPNRERPLTPKDDGHGVMYSCFQS